MAPLRSAAPQLNPPSSVPQAQRGLSFVLARVLPWNALPHLACQIPPSPEPQKARLHHGLHPSWSAHPRSLMALPSGHYVSVLLPGL